MKRLVVYLILFVAVHVIIIEAAISRTNGSDFKYPVSGAFAHFSAFFAVTLVSSFILTHSKIKFSYPYIISFLYSGVFAAFIEYIQRYYEYRVSSFDDILWGVAGSLVCIFVIKAALKTRAGRKIHSLLT